MNPEPEIGSTLLHYAIDARLGEGGMGTVYRARDTILNRTVALKVLNFDLPYETAQLPMFRMLGTPAADKSHVVLEGGHLPPKPQEVFKEILDWLDKYLGPVR